jgi:FkbM family methyltransferase
LVLARVRDRWALLRYQRLLRKLAGGKLMRAFGDAYPAASFIEIGANDGTHNDHLREMILRHQWHGILVEPVPYVFERLRQNYGHIDRLILENVAIADHDGNLPFYYPAPLEDADRGRMPPWYDEIGSFSEPQVLAHADAIPDIEDRLVSTEVRCLTLESLFAKHAVRDLDLIVIDAEGYDPIILRQIDFERRRPRMVVYEHYHLGDSEREACLGLVRDHGYETLEEGLDTWCLLTDVDDSVTARWRRLRPGLPALSFATDPSRNPPAA